MIDSMSSVAMTPVGAMLFGAIRYVIENGAVNQVAFGVPWHLGWARDNPLSGPLFEILRMSWLAAPVLALAFLIVRRNDGSVALRIALRKPAASAPRLSASSPAVSRSARVPLAKLPEASATLALFFNAIGGGH